MHVRLYTCGFFVRLDDVCFRRREGIVSVSSVGGDDCLLIDGETRIRLLQHFERSRGNIRIMARRRG
jgi:hypothetical protein